MTKPRRTAELVAFPPDSDKTNTGRDIDDIRPQRSRGSKTGRDRKLDPTTALLIPDNLKHDLHAIFQSRKKTLARLRQLESQFNQLADRLYGLEQDLKNELLSKGRYSHLER